MGNVAMSARAQRMHSALYIPLSLWNEKVPVSGMCVALCPSISLSTFMSLIDLSGELEIYIYIHMGYISQTCEGI